MLAELCLGGNGLRSEQATELQAMLTEREATAKSNPRYVELATLNVDTSLPMELYEGLIRQAGPGGGGGKGKKGKKGKK